MSVVDLTHIDFATEEDRLYEIDFWASFFKELESLQEHPAKCSGKLMRFRNPKHNKYKVIKEQSDLPFMD